jgi:hypothetical protein
LHAIRHARRSGDVIFAALQARNSWPYFWLHWRSKKNDLGGFRGHFP